MITLAFICFYGQSSQSFLLDDVAVLLNFLILGIAVILAGCTFQGDFTDSSQNFVSKSIALVLYP